MLDLGLPRIDLPAEGEVGEGTGARMDPTVLVIGGDEPCLGLELCG